MLQQYFCNNIILMKQILILYFCYFEPMSLWYTNFTSNARNGESWGNIIGSSLSLARTPTVKSAHAGSTERARRLFGIGELNHGRVCATQARLHRTGFRTCVQHARLRPRLARKTYWTGLRTAALAARFSIRSIYTPSARTKLQTNCTCRSAVCYSSTQFHQQTYMIQTIRRVDRKHSVRFLWRRFSSRDTPTVSKSRGTAFWIFKFNFNLPFLMIAVKLL